MWTLPAYKLLIKMAKHPSPAKKLRSIKRLLTFRLQNIRMKTPSLTVSKVVETNYPASKPNLSTINLQQISIPARMSNLSIQCVQTTSIPSHPVTIKPPRPKLQVMVTSNTCDSPECRYRKRPCHGGNPETQIYHDACYSKFL